MKNYKMTSRGKMLFATYFIAMIGSYFLSAIIFYFLSGLLVVLLFVETINYLVHFLNNKTNKGGETISKDKIGLEVKTENAKKAIKRVDEDQVAESKEVEGHTDNKSTDAAFDSIKKEVEYGNIVDDYESMAEDIQSIERDLEVIGKKATNISEASVKNYYLKKKKEIASNLDNSVSEDSQTYEEESLIDSLFQKLKDLFNFRRYKKGRLVLHNHFGIGKIISTEDILKVSFINDHIEEIIEFEYDKNNKIPELDLFKAPKNEDEGQYYYNYKRDVSTDLLRTIEKIELNLPDIKCQWNVFLKSEDSFEKYDFIAISDQVHVFSKTSKERIQCEILEKLLEDIDLKIKKHEISDYSSINSILLKAKIKGNMSLDLVNTINQRIAKSNIKDFNERMHYSDKIENL